MGIRISVLALWTLLFPAVVSAQSADLSMGAFQVSPTVGPAGGNVNLTFTIQNSGKVDAGPFHVAIYFSEDSTLDPNTDTVLKEYLINGLPVGRSTLERVQVRIPKNATINKVSYIFVRADSKNVIKESNESNNTTSTTFNVKAGPDITIKSITSTPDPGIVRSSIRISVQYTNIGRTDSRPFDLELFLSPDPVLDSGDSKIYSVRVNTLYKGETKTLTYNYYISPGKVGTFYIFAVADRKGEVPEEDEGNNSKSHKVTFVEAKKPDLTLEQLQIVDPNKRLGERLLLKVLVKNIGSAASGYFYLEIQYSRHPLFLPGYYSSRSYRYYTRLGAGSSRTIQLGFDIPWRKPYDVIRDYYIRARVYTYSPESSTANNLSNTVTFRPLPPLARLELTGISIYKYKTNSFPCNVVLDSAGRVVAPDTFTLSFSVANRGFRLSSSVKINFYLSKDRIISKSDLLVASYTIPALPPSFTYSRTVLKFRFTVSIPAGRYHFGALLDPDGQRQNDYRNGRTQLYLWHSVPRVFSPARADWKILSFSANPSQRAVTGAQIKISVSARQVNSSFTSCPYPYTNYLKVGFWRDKNLKLSPLFSWNTYFYGTSISRNVTITVPTSTPSTSGYLAAIVDPDDRFVESDEKNNVSFIPYSIGTHSHDFTVSSLKVDSSTLVWEKRHRLDFTVENIGTLKTSTYIYLRFFLSEDSKISYNDISLGYTSMWYRGSTIRSYITFQAQRWRVGKYYIIAQVNYNRQVRESDYTNNIRYIPVSLRKFKVDFQSPKVTITPKIIRAGRDNTVLVDVINAGPDKHIDRTAVCLYFSNDSVFHTDDTRVACWPTSDIYGKTGQIKFTFKGTRTLIAGKRYFIIQLDSGITGPYTWGWRWRPYKRYDELNEKNNLLFFPVEVKNDVDVTTSFLATSKTTLKIGETVIFRFKVKNVGSIPTNINFQVWPVFSDDLKLDTSDRVIRKITVPSLDAGKESSDFYVSFAVDKKVRPGERYIGVLVDPLDAVKESDETNNSGSIMLNILIPGIDLQVRSGKLDRTVIPSGQKASVKVYSEFQNFGTITSPPFEIGFYLSRDEKLDPSDTLLAIRNYSKSLPSTAKTGQFVDTLSVTLKGTDRAYILIAADHKNQISEPLEDNNVLALPIRTTNKPPKITSLPVTSAVEKQPYTYRLKGYDPDGDPLVWRLLEAPAGMVLDPKTATLSWTPQNFQGGAKFQVKVELNDGRGGSDVQDFYVSVRAVNDPPSIVSVPPKFAVAGRVYFYGARAVDPDRGDRLEWGVVSGPAGMTIDKITGLLRWPVPQSMSGKKVSVEIKVRDRAGASSTQKFSIQIGDKNRPPRIVSKPPTDVSPGATLIYRPKAVDPDPNERLFWRRLAGPTNLRVDPDTGEVRWPVPTSLAGIQIAVSIEVRDRLGASDRQDFVVLVRNINHPPKITSQPPKRALIGSLWTYRPKAVDPDVGDKLTWQLVTGPAGVKFEPADGTIRWLPTNIHYKKSVPFKIKVSDGRGGEDSQEFSVAVFKKCRLDSDCAGGEICSGGECVGAGCFANGCPDPDRPVCGSDGKCASNPCKNVTCGSGQFCRQGKCVGVCAGVKCPPGESCFDGKCRPDPCANVSCPSGTTCKAGKCVTDFCSYGSCSYGRTCADGKCRPDPCKWIKCPKGARCLSGQCVNLTCQVDSDCPGEEVCEDGKCSPPGCLRSGGCPSGQICYKLACGSDPCAGVKCREGEFCRDGKCVGSCAGVTCKKGEYCRDGKCVADPCSGKSCKSGQVCIPRVNGCREDRCSEKNPCKYGRVCHQNRCFVDPCRFITCPSKFQLCRYGQCTDPPTCAVDADCPGTEICAGARCIEPECSDSSPCPGGELCFDGKCKENSCKGVKCKGGEYCRAGKCVSSCAGIFCSKGEECRDGKCVADPCSGVSCKAGEVCHNGKCVKNICANYKRPCKYGRICTPKGCVDNRCRGVRCPSGQRCDPLTGQCFGPVKCRVDSDCPAGGICKGGYCAPPGCYGKKCPDGQRCSGGTCVRDRCARQKCSDGYYCRDGRCLPLCNCPAGTVCTERGCQPDPCAQLSCDVGSSCYRGSCGQTCPKDACRYGRICRPGPYCTDDPCRDVQCPEGYVCQEGFCVDSCSLLRCPAGMSCLNGKCSKIPSEENDRELPPEPIVEESSGVKLPDRTEGELQISTPPGGCGCSALSAPTQLFFLAVLFLLGLFLRKNRKNWK